MDKRRYVQRARARSAEATRERVLAAARASLERGPVGALKLEEVAREAGVARSTIYVLFGSRPGLIEALAYRLRDDAGFEHVVAANRLPDAREAFRAALRASVRAYASHAALARGLFTLAAIDPDAVAGLAAIEDGRRPGMQHLAGRLDRQGQLRPDVSVAEAADLLTVVTSFQAFDQLLADGTSPEVIADRLVALGERSVCREPDGGPGA
jgi:AcrR family transcriptional regulator